MTSLPALARQCGQAHQPGLRLFKYRFAQTQAESCPIVSVWVTLMPYWFEWRHYVRYGYCGNNPCDSGGCVVLAARVKRVSQPLGFCPRRPRVRG
jgi:hypothetical protein